MRRDAASRLRVIVLGYIVRGPLGGFAWHHLQYVTGLARLGHEVIFVEESGTFPGCYNPESSSVGVDPSYGLRFIADAFEGCGVGDRWAYHDMHSSRWHGPRADSVINDCAQADLLINLCDAEPLPEWLAGIPVRALIDTDPVFSQVRHLEDPVARAAADEHTMFFSFGENIESGRSSVPDDGFPWQATRQPIDLEAWPVVAPARAGRWTTVMQWDSYPAVEHDRERYGMKSQSFVPYIDLPRDVRGELEIALGSPTAPREQLQEHGWQLRDPLEVSRTPWAYRAYLQASKGEFAVAKQGYVASRSGWFSERSACYLASGRPVVLQDTGFSDLIPTGEGVLAFTTPEEARSCLDAVERGLAYHSAAAREIAVEVFDARRVLPSLLERALQVHRSEAIPS